MIVQRNPFQLKSIYLHRLSTGLLRNCLAPFYPTRKKYKQMKHIAQILLLFLPVTFLFCGGANRNNMAADATLAEKSISYDQAESPSPGAEMMDVSADTTVYDRKLTKTGTLRFESSDLDNTKQAVHRIVSELNGYISNENSSESAGHTEHSMTIRVPAEKFDELVLKLESSASKIDYKSIDVQDVTEEYIDLDTRVKTKKEVEARYRELLKRAVNVEEIMKIEEQIGNIRTEIESAEGRLKYLSNQVKYSTLTVTFYDKTSHFGFWYKMRNAFLNGWNNLLWVFVAIANLWAVVLFVIVIWIVIFYFRRQKRKIPRA